MLAKERQNEIIDMLVQNGGIIKMTDIVKRFNISHETARRDLETLQDQNIVKRIYGGAILVKNEGLIDVSTKIDRSDHSYAERVAIGKAAAELVSEGETILLGTGTTVLEIARNIKHLNNFTIVTNSLPVINELLNTKFDIYILGGKLDVNELNISGHIGLMALKNFFVDKAFIGAGGITFNYGVSDYGTSDISIRQEILNHANKKILVAHSDKFGTNALSFSFPLNRLDIIVSDINLSQEYVTGIRELGMELILAKHD